MIKTKIYTIITLSAILTLLIIPGFMVFNQIRPANQLHNRGVGMQIWPEYITRMPEELYPPNFGRYIPYMGSMYRSGY